MNQHADSQQPTGRCPFFLNPQRSGRIFNVGSIAGYLSSPFLGVYSSTKAALLSLNEALRLELRPFNVQASSDTKFCLLKPTYSNLLESNLE